MMCNTRTSDELLGEREAIVHHLMMLLTLLAASVAAFSLDGWIGLPLIAMVSWPIGLATRRLMVIQDELHGSTPRFQGGDVRRIRNRSSRSKKLVPAKTSIAGSALATACLFYVLNGWRAINGSDDGTYLLTFAIAVMAGTTLLKLRSWIIGSHTRSS